jgi:VIT1/CCC1 family predicted Fe2+/Mn2+ transporter
MAKVHVERHFRASETVRDIVIGISDGLTVPFALAAGLSGAQVAPRVVVHAGLAEIVAGSIAMGLGGYMAARTDREHYEHELQREIDETRNMPDEERAEVARVFEDWGLGPEHVGPIVTAISADQQRWVDFMMRYELGLEAPDPKRAGRSAVTIFGSYIGGGFVPLAPYFFATDVESALAVSVALTAVALFIFGAIKGRFTGIAPARGGLETTLIGGAAAGAAFLIARLFR